MVPELQKSQVYYRSPVGDCPTKTVREEEVKAAIAACMLRSQLSVPDMIDFNVRVEAWIASGEDREWEKAWQLRKANLQDRIDRLTDALIDRLIDREAFAVPTPRSAGGRQPNLLHLSGLTPTDEGRRLTLNPDTKPGDRQSRYALASGTLIVTALNAPPTIQLGPLQRGGIRIDSYENQYASLLLSSCPVQG